MLSFVILGISYYLYKISPVGDDNIMKTVQIDRNASGHKIALVLKENNLIKDVTLFKVYLKLNNINNLKHGVYNLNSMMSVKEIVGILVKGTSLTGDEIDLLFREGINIRHVARVIANNTNNSEDDVFNLLEDEEYIDGLIIKYWFLTDEIKNPNIYYPLEGYLAPNTYRFASSDVSVKTIFTTMLNQTDKILTKYKDNIDNSDFNIHDFLTMASIVESEGVNDIDRPKIAGVFYNRLNSNWTFGSCVTACYGGKVESCIPGKVPTKHVNPYNTYLTNMAGKLPVGPISLPGETSIAATVSPVEHHYYYFISDKYRRTYFFDRNATGRDQKINELKAAGLWISN
jgi:UPF0755 protein